MAACPSMVFVPPKSALEVELVEGSFACQLMTITMRMMIALCACLQVVDQWFGLL